MTFDGACLCGTVRFAFDDDAVKWVAHCHCSMCRRAHAAPYVTWVGVREEGYRVLAGAEHVRRYDSSDAAFREHCDACGSPLSFRGQRWAGEVHVPRALVHSDELRQPQAHAFWDSRAAWVHVEDALPKLKG